MGRLIDEQLNGAYYESTMSYTLTHIWNILSKVTEYLETDRARQLLNAQRHISDIEVYGMIESDEYGACVHKLAALCLLRAS